MSDIASLDELKDRFKKELSGITDIAELKELYASELAKRDKLIQELQNQNKLILKTAFKQQEDSLKMKKEE